MSSFVQRRGHPAPSSGTNLILRPKSLWALVWKDTRRGVLLCVPPTDVPAMPETENAVTLRGNRAGGTILRQNHPLGSYKDNTITFKWSRRTQTPTGPSGNYFSTQRSIETLAP